MKKSLIALSLVSVFAAGGASAAVNTDEVVRITDKQVETFVKERGMRLVDGHDAEGKEITTIYDKEGNYYGNVSKKDGHISVVDNQSNQSLVIDTENGQGIYSDGQSETRFESASEIDVNKKVEEATAERARNRVDIENIRKEADEAARYIDSVGGKAVEEIYNTGSAVAAKSVANENRINKLEDSFKDMAARQDKFEDKLNKMDKKMDGVMAGTHAVTNARPMVAGGQTAFGVGTGFAGSAQAVAVGVAHNFKDSAWSVSATTNVSTGSGVKTQVSGGVGAHYVF